MSKEIKQIRGQVRQIVKEILPDTLTQEHYLVLKQHVDERINQIEKFVKEKLTEMNERHKDTMGYLVRQTTSVQDKK